MIVLAVVGIGICLGIDRGVRKCGSKISKRRIWDEGIQRGKKNEQEVLDHYILYECSVTIYMETLKESCLMETFLKQWSAHVTCAWCFASESLIFLSNS